MKVLFIADNLCVEQEPLGIMHLSAALKKAGHRTQAINGERLCDGVGEEVRKIAPGLVAFSSTTGLHKLHLAMARNIKKALDIPIIMGNAHATFFPEVLEEDCLDFICRGEGEEAIVVLVNALEAGEDPSHILNIDAKIKGKIIRNGLRPFNQNLDGLPFPDRELTNDLNPYFIDGTSHFITGRGCPYDCSYCFNLMARDMASGKYIRRRSVDSVISELLQVKAANRSRMMNFQDDTFILDKVWLEEFSKRYKKEIALPYLCHVRANLINPQVAAWLADSGCKIVALGVEAGNDYLRNKILNRNLSREQIVRACHTLLDVGIDVLSQNLVGIPYETAKSFWETLELNRRCRPTVMQINIYKPSPNQRLSDLAIERGFFNGDYDALPDTYYERLSLDLKDKSELEWIIRVSNLIYDSRLVRLAARALMFLPHNSNLKLRGFRWLSAHEAGIRKRLGCKDSRWAPLRKYWAPPAPKAPPAPLSQEVKNEVSSTVS